MSVDGRMTKGMDMALKEHPHIGGLVVVFHMLANGRMVRRMEWAL